MRGSRLSFLRILHAIVWLTVLIRAEDLLEDGPASMERGSELFRQGDYDQAAQHFWRGVLFQEASNGAYTVQDAFQKFMQCYQVQGKVADGFVFIAAQSLERGQTGMSQTYVEQALEIDPHHEEALTLKERLKKIQNVQKRPKAGDDEEEDPYLDMTPEELYEKASVFFARKNYEGCADVFELSCIMSNHRLSPSCSNAVYCRNNVVDWGFNGTQFQADMELIVEITTREARQMRIDFGNGTFAWNRATSTHPHMMLGYPLEDSMLKRYVAESVAFMDEKHARLTEDGVLRQLPPDMPYRPKPEDYAGTSKIRVGFVGSGFNSKAVLYLSQDMFRFFDSTRFETHIFSCGPADSEMFIEHGMRGVDWRERVKSNVDFFHDVQEMKMDHVAMAKHIHDHQIHILIEWDGYARQGERAQGLFALRPAPVQILHQEYLGTSGAQYVDYIFTDKVTSPPHLDGLYTEKFIYLPNHFFSKGHAVQEEVKKPTHEYPPATNPYVLGTGSPKENRCLTGPVDPSFVFCNFNKFLKNNPETVRSWIRILREVPGSILCLLENPQSGIPYLRRFVHEAAATSSNNDPDTMEPGDGEELNNRIHFLKWERNPFDHQMRNQDFCNVMLDSYPYNGHTVAQDSLYGGVPIVTRSDGDDMSSRVSTSANVVLGLDELNAYEGPRQYEDIAIALGTNQTMYEAIRTKLVNTALQMDPMHPYWDVPRYVKNFESGLQAAWDRFMSGQPPEHITVVESEETERGTFQDTLRNNPPMGTKRHS